jgi:acyl-CoA thioester hydrolase
MAVARMPVRRRFSDIDVLGHVNNVAYLEYMQEARVHAMWDAKIAEGIGITHVVVRQEIDYKRAIKLAEDPLIVEVWVSDIGRTSYTFSYRIFDEIGLASEAKSIMVAIDVETGAPLRISEQLREALEALREE